MAIGVRSRCCHEKAAYALQSKQRQIFQLCNLLSFDLIQACLNRVLDILHPDNGGREDLDQGGSGDNGVGFVIIRLEDP